MKAITVKYLGQTNTLPARYKAFDSDKNYAISTQSSHAAVRNLCKQMHWTGTLIEGHLEAGVMVYVWAEGFRVKAEV